MSKLKGHAVIELTDVKTGKKERHEHDNLITNVAKDYIDFFIAASSRGDVNGSLLPLVNNLFGGVFLFDNTLTENVNNKTMPAITDAKLTGYAGHVTSDGNDNKRGDYNAEESGAIENGYKMVWDFGTNDANGEIAALALTHSIAGYHGYHYNTAAACRQPPTNTSNAATNYKGINNNFSASGAPAALRNCTQTQKDADGNYIFKCVFFTSNTNIRIEYYKLNVKSVNLSNANIGAFSLVERTDHAIQATPQDYTYFQVLESGGYYYAVGKYSSTLYLIKYSSDDFSVLSSQNVSRSSGNDYYMDTYFDYYAAQKPAIRGNYLYIAFGRYEYNSSSSVYYSTYYIHKININDLTDYENLTPNRIDVSTFNFMPTFTLLPNGDIDALMYIIDADDNLIDNGAYPYGWGWRQSSLRIIKAGDFDISIIRYNNSSYGTDIRTESFLQPNFQCLATVNNLDTPVTKTAAKTMKITYTLTYAAE